MLYEIRDGLEWHKYLEASGLSEIDLEELRESLDMTLSRSPETNEMLHSGPITVYVESFTPRSLKPYLVLYRIEGYTVILEELHRDYSQDF